MQQWRWRPSWLYIQVLFLGGGVGRRSVFWFCACAKSKAARRAVKHAFKAPLMPLAVAGWYRISDHGVQNIKITTQNAPRRPSMATLFRRPMMFLDAQKASRLHSKRLGRSTSCDYRAIILYEDGIWSQIPLVHEAPDAQKKFCSKREKTHTRTFRKAERAAKRAKKIQLNSF
jgi:hypothetical protein